MCSEFMYSTGCFSLAALDGGGGYVLMTFGALGAIPGTSAAREGGAGVAPVAGPIVVERVVTHRVDVHRYLACRLNWDKGTRSRIVVAVEGVEN